MKIACNGLKGEKVKLCLKLTKSNPVAVMFSLQQVVGQIGAARRAQWLYLDAQNKAGASWLS